MARLVDHMGCDEAIVDAARVSYAKGTKVVSDTRSLIRYLMRHWHTTPFEMVEFKFHIRAPIFVARQWMRHRTASVNEVSARYSILDDEFFLPDHLRSQSATNKQGSEEEMSGDQLLILKQKASCDMAFHVYGDLLKQGCSRELARTHLPVSTMTEFFWKINLHNLFHFLKLRMDSHAQPEIQVLAKQVYELIRPIVPIACEAFEDFVLNTITFSGPEIKAMKTRTGIPGVSEQREFQEKLDKISWRI